MDKKKPSSLKVPRPTAGDIERDDLTDAQRVAYADDIAHFLSAVRKTATLHRQVEQWRREAEMLYETLPNLPFQKLETFIKDNPPSPGAICWLIFVAKDAVKDKTQGAGAAARAAKYEIAKRFILSQWEEDHAAYEDNQSKFAREMSDLICKDNKEFAGLSVKPSTITTWLRATKMQQPE